jgi:outer membrane protein OmpA-like peptidoglycan-associated protein
VKETMASWLVLSLGVADLAVLNLVLAPRLSERRRPAGPEAVDIAAEARAIAPPPAPVPAASAPLAPSAPPPPDRGPSEAAPDIVFELGGSEVPASRGADVRRLAEELRAPGGRTLVLRGHADRLGLASRNLALSRLRAESVQRLLGVFGAPADRIVVEAAGDAEPASTEDTPRGWARNRRVQLHFR